LNPFSILALILLFSLPAFAQQRWERNYGGGRDDEGYSVQQTADGGYIIVGYTDSYGNGDQVYLVKTNPFGDTLWTRTYGGPLGDLGASVQQTSDGGYIITGSTTSFGAGNWDVYLIKTDSTGSTLWMKTYGKASGDDGRSVQQTSDGGYIIAGGTYSAGSSTQVYLIKTNSSGDIRWTQEYGGTSEDESYSVRQTSDGGYIIAGTTASFGGGFQVYLVKTDSTGDTLWTRSYGGGADDRGRSVQPTTDGGYIIAGMTWSFGVGSDVYLIKTNTTGDTLWTRNYGGSGWECSNSCQQATDGGYIIAGQTGSFSNAYQVYLLKINVRGDTLWTRTYGGADYEDGKSVQQTQDGGYIVTGYSNSFGNSRQVYLIKTDAYGSSRVEESRQGDKETRRQGERLRATPNPFTSFASVPGHEAERFSLYDIAGRKVGTYPGSRIGEGLSPGVYFLRYQEMLKQVQHDEIVRIVKVR